MIQILERHPFLVKGNRVNGTSKIIIWEADTWSPCLRMLGTTITYYTVVSIF